MPLTPDPLSAEQIKDITENFPIGGRIDYYPEYQQHMLMPSIILGYEINGQRIYSQNQLSFSNTSGGTPKLSVNAGDGIQDYLQASSFCFMLPGNAGEENKLDYPSKASLGRRGQFRNGNNITLIARQADQGVVTLESNVRESIQSKDGYYRGHMLSLLEIFTPELLFRDQRTHHRIKTRLPIQIQLDEKDSPHPCLLSDYSELHAQIEMGEESSLLLKLKEKDTVTLGLKLEQSHRSFVIKASIIRKHPNSIVVSMEKTLRNNRFEPFELMDALELKASLLQHPGTS